MTLRSGKENNYLKSIKLQVVVMDNVFKTIQGTVQWAIYYVKNRKVSG